MGKFKESASVTLDVITQTITHNLNDANAILTKTTPNWPTTVYWTSKTANTIVVGFSTPAPASANLDSVVET